MPNKGLHIHIDDETGEAKAFKSRDELEKHTEIKPLDEWIYYFNEDSQTGIRNISYYITKAMCELGKTDIHGNLEMASERELSQELEKSHNVANNWQKGKALPNDDTMVGLARVAKEDPIKAVIELNIWRTTGVAREIYKSLWKAHVKKISCILIALIISTAPAHASANSKEGMLQYGKDTVYYGNQ